MNENLAKNPDELPLVNGLMKKLQNTYRLNISLLQIFLKASYDNERQSQTTYNLHVKPLNVSKVQFICQVSIYYAAFNDYSLVRMMVTSFICSQRTEKTEKIRLRQPIVS